jgi:hypothetical protein
MAREETKGCPQLHVGRLSVKDPRRFYNIHDYVARVLMEAPTATTFDLNSSPDFTESWKNLGLEYLYFRRSDQERAKTPTGREMYLQEVKRDLKEGFGRETVSRKELEDLLKDMDHTSYDITTNRGNKYYRPEEDYVRDYQPST